MKYILFFAILFSNAVRATEPVPVGIDDVVKRVSQNNFKVYENAQRVYQAKLNIEKARGELLPKLNIWSLAKVIIDPLSIVDSITDVAPFLVPANWFRAEEVRLIYLAEKEGYRALWGNEVYAAKSLFTHYLMDQNLLVYTQSSILEMNKIHKIVQTREDFGGAKAGTAREIEIKILGLMEDEQNLLSLLRVEHDELSYLLGYEASTILSTNPIKLLDLEKLSPIQLKDYEFRMLSTSPERRQFDHFLSVLSEIKKEIEYSFLGGSTISRGVGGGVFDGLPEGGDLSFGTGSALKIVETQREVMSMQKRGVEEVLKRQLRLVAIQFNSDLGNYKNFKRRAELSRQSKNSILRRIQLGETVDVMELSEVLKNQIQAEAALLAVQYRAYTATDRLNRLIFAGDYALDTALDESLKEANREANKEIIEAQP